MCLCTVYCALFFCVEIIEGKKNYQAIEKELLQASRKTEQDSEVSMYVYYDSVHHICNKNR